MTGHLNGLQTSKYVNLPLPIHGDMYLFRLISIAFITWGLIVPPLFAGIPPASVSGNEPVVEKLVVAKLNVSLSSSAQGSHAHNTQMLAKSACHNNFLDNLPVRDNCIDCSLDHISGSVCGTSCVSSGAVISYSAGPLPIQHTTGAAIGGVQPLYSGYFDRIYYPPKFS
jgi:hypothetical protein